MKRDARIFVAGASGLLGRALVRRLRAAGFSELLLPAHRDLDLERAQEVQAFFRAERPEYVFLAAARVGGIVANQKSPADFITSNLAIPTHVLRAAHESEADGLCFFGSSCMYPRDGRQPISEEDLGLGPLEETSRAYAIAKLAGVELCRAYRTQFGRRFFALVPATLYGPHDHFASERAHVIPALITRIHDARRRGDPAVTVLGSGRARREFLHCDDAAEAAIFLMSSGAELDLLNIGSGEEVTIADLAHRIARVAGFTGSLRFDRRAPDGAERKLLDSRRARALGWRPRIALDSGLEQAYRWYASSVEGSPRS
ncbi:MAG: GDP-L-fucose synthase family protein [Myxococcota bacterium]